MHVCGPLLRALDYFVMRTSPPSPAPPSPRPTALEAAHTSLQQRLGEAVLELDAARVAKGQAEVDFEVGTGAGWCAVVWWEGRAVCRAVANCCLYPEQPLFSGACACIP